MSPFRKDETSRGILSFHDTHTHPHDGMHAEDIRLLLLSNKTHGVRGRGTGDGVHSITQRSDLSQMYRLSH